MHKHRIREIKIGFDRLQSVKERLQARDKQPVLRPRDTEDFVNEGRKFRGLVACAAQADFEETRNELGGDGCVFSVSRSWAALRLDVMSVLMEERLKKEATKQSELMHRWRVLRMDENGLLSLTTRSSFISARVTQSVGSNSSRESAIDDPSEAKMSSKSKPPDIPLPKNWGHPPRFLGPIGGQ